MAPVRAARASATSAGGVRPSSTPAASAPIMEIAPTGATLASPSIAERMGLTTPRSAPRRRASRYAWAAATANRSPVRFTSGCRRTPNIWSIAGSTASARWMATGSSSRASAICACTALARDSASARSAVVISATIRRRETSAGALLRTALAFFQDSSSCSGVS